MISMSNVYRVLTIALVAGLYYGAARLGLMLQLPGTNASPVWPPSGIGFAAILLLGMRVWPGILIGAFLANLLTLPYTTAGALASAGICVGNTLEHVVGLWLIRRVVRSGRPFDRAADLFRFVGVAAVACLIASTIGATSLWLTGIIPGVIYGAVWFTWWLGDLAGMLTLTPAIERWWREPRLALASSRLAELAALSVVTIAVTELLFGGWFATEVIDSLPYLVVPCLIWAAFRFRPKETSTAAVLISVIAIWHTWEFVGQALQASKEPGITAAMATLFSPFVRPSLTANDSLLMLQLFICAIALTGETLATAIADQRRAVQEIQRYVTELERSNRELDQVAYSVSHDLKAPLRAVHNLADWIAEDAGHLMPENSRGDLALMQQRIVRMERLLEDLLAYSRIGRGKHSVDPIDCGELVREVVQLLAPSAGFTIQIGELPVLSAERAPLEQVFRNLIGNAIKHHDRADGRVEITARDLGERVEFVVRDDGPGIPAEYHALVFQMFKTLKPRDEVEGSGMGLALVKKIVENQRGSITLTSSPGQGAAFQFTWPKTRE